MNVLNAIEVHLEMVKIWDMLSYHNNKVKNEPADTG
jgi:hypothetical protein